MARSVPGLEDAPETAASGTASGENSQDSSHGFPSKEASVRKGSNTHVGRTVGSVQMCARKD
ncbi:hypothetical protein GCM10018966_027600 [Streptomyces yanii]